MNSKIPYRKDSLIYVACPAFHKTGGTELLHQYVKVLTENGFNANIVYPDATANKNINPAFLKYVNNYLNLEDVIDSENNILVVPEVMTFLLRKFKNIKKVIWWESVDNYYRFKSLKLVVKNIKNYPGWIKEWAKDFLCVDKEHRSLSIKEVRKLADYHFAQSFYAIDFLNKNKIQNNIFYVSDFINDMYIKESSEVDLSKKQDIVCYNPAKGIAITRKIIQACEGYNFVPLANMTNEEIVNTLKKSKVYIDFGNHPGKDRLPREAAILNCCIITNKDGAANYYEDVQIDNCFKFGGKNNSVIKKIKKAITNCFDNYFETLKQYDDYRKKIVNEKSCFYNDVVNCYERID